MTLLPDWGWLALSIPITCTILLVSWKRKSDSMLAAAAIATLCASWFVGLIALHTVFPGAANNRVEWSKSLPMEAAAIFLVWMIVVTPALCGWAIKWSHRFLLKQAALLNEPAAAYMPHASEGC